MLNIELHDDNLKQFCQALEEVFSSLDHNIFLQMAGKLVRETAQKVYAHEERFVVTSFGHSSQTRNRRATGVCEQRSTILSEIRDNSS